MYAALFIYFECFSFSFYYDLKHKGLKHLRHSLVTLRISDECSIVCQTHKITQKNLDCIYLQNAHSFQVIVTFYAIVIQFPPTHPLHPHSPTITRGYLTHSSATDCSHLSKSEAVCRRDR